MSMLMKDEALTSFDWMGKTTIGSLLPLVGKDPFFAQLYIHDTKKEIHYRLSALPGQESQYDLDIAIVQILLKALDENNVLVKTFCMARDRFKDSNMYNVRLRLIGSRSSDGREQNIPTCSEVAAIILGSKIVFMSFSIVVTGGILLFYN